MAVTDRVRRMQERRKAQQADDSRQDSPGQSTLVRVDPPHITRFKGVLSVLRAAIEANQDGSGMARMGFILTTVGNELAEELAEMDELQIRILLAQMGEVIAWIGHGDNERLPDSIRTIAETVQPSATHTDSNTPVEIGTSTG